MTQFLLLVTGNHRPGKSAVTVPTAGLRPRIAARHPTKEFPIVNDEVGERELMRIEQERRDAKRKNGEPEVDQMGNPNGQRDIEQDEEVSEAHVDAGSSKAGVENAEIDASRSETTTSGDISGTTKGQIAEDRVGVDLGGENFEDGR